MSTAIILQLIIFAAWGVTLLRSTRRLCRLALASLPATARGQAVHKQARRLWWWLGRDEFWSVVRVDAAYCIEVTLLVFLLGLNW